jgi:hypothetical protein
MAQQDRHGHEFEPWGAGQATAEPSRPSSNGSKPGAEGLSAAMGWDRRRYGAKPAFIPLLIGLVILFIFGAIAISQRGTPAPRGATPAPATQSYAGIRAVGAGADFGPSGGQPPSDVLAQTMVPEGSAPGKLLNLARNGGTYDSEVPYTVSLSPAQVLSFYQAQLRAGGWRVESTGPTPNEVDHEEILAQRAGSDGNYWEVGADVTTAASPGAGPGAQRTPFTLRLLVVGSEQ